MPWIDFDEHTWRFIKTFIRRPATMGSILPSSPYLVAEIIKTAELHNKKSIVQLGVGTGVITRAVIEAKAKDAKYLGLDVDPQFVGDMKEAFPSEEFVIGSAEHVDEIVNLKKFGGADLIISALPWTLFASDRQHKIIGAISKILKPHGLLLGYVYGHAQVLPTGLQFYRRLTAAFEVFETGDIVWRNIPPARVFYAAKPRK